jgi:hypothetical protein
MLEYRNGYVAINSTHSKLITVLRTVVEKGNGTLAKEATSYDIAHLGDHTSILLGGQTGRGMTK